MGIIDYFKKSFRRKSARRYTREYPATITSFNLSREGKIEFANWDNPLVPPKAVSQEMVDFFKKFITEGDLVIDIGANIGDTTVPMALAAGRSGITLGFDPNPYVYKILQINASLNKEKQNIVPLLYAITVQEEDFYYVSSEASFSNGAISPSKNSKHGKYIYPDKIKGVNLLQFLKANYSEKLKDLSFIKIDAEGYDKEIIKSISDIIERYKPTIIAESFGDSPNAAKIELYNVISRHGYEIFYFEDFDINAKTIKLDDSHEVTNWRKTINIYAVPKE